MDTKQKMKCHEIMLDELLKVSEEEYKGNYQRDWKYSIKWIMDNLALKPVPFGMTSELPTEVLRFGHYGETAIKKGVLLRDGGKCCICGAETEETKLIRPAEWNGHNHPRNMLTMCKTCQKETDELRESYLNSVIMNSVFRGNMRVQTRLEDFL